MIEVIQGDALTFDAAFFAQFDSLICDPAYSDDVHENATSVGVVGGGLGVHSRDLEFPPLSTELRAHIALAAATVKRWSAIFSDVQSSHLWARDADAAGAEAIRIVPWIRWSQPQLSGDRPPTCWEAVNVFHSMRLGPRGGRYEKAKHWNGPGGFDGGVFDWRCMRGQDKHPTEKPLDLMLSIVMHFSDPGEAVLDLTGGSGTTALACRMLGRECVAIELREDWARKAATRVKSNLSPRDQVRAEEWCNRVYAEASGALEKPPAADGSDRNTRERAERRIADIERVASAL